jgi:DNA-binding NarL/FixJ family response regulator
MRKISIVIVDDHKLVRETWALILNSELSFEVIAQCETGEEGVTVAKEHRPDIVIMDINLSGINGFEATSQIRKFSPGSKILGVSMHTQPTYVKQMIQKGAMGYVTKNSTKEELFHAIKEIHSGKKYICQQIKEILSDLVINKNDTYENPINSLSQREMEIVGLIKKGLSSKEIAVQLFISAKTVEVHRYNLMKKLKLKNAAALVDFVNKTYSDLP